MDEVKNEQATLRDQLSEALEAQEVTQPVTVEPVAAAPTETAEQKAGRLAGRARDEQGRVLPGKAVKPDAGAQAAEAVRPAGVDKQTFVDPVAPAPLERPSSWKKIEEWNALPRPIQEEIRRRESDYANGVSTYKREADYAKPLIEAIAPFQPLLQQHGIEPGQWIANLGNAHKALAMGSPQEKLGMFQKLLGEYGLKDAALAIRGADGQYQLLGQMPQAQQQQQQPQDVRKLVQEALTEQYTQQEIARFGNDKEKHPHYEQVRGTMAGLLQSGLAENLEDAYEAALRHPRHSDIYDAMQKQQREADEKTRRDQAVAQAQKARSSAVSVRSATPSAVANAAGQKGLRAQLESTFDEVTASRV